MGEGGRGGTWRDAGGVLEKRENSNSNKLIPQNSVRSVGLNRSSRDRRRQAQIKRDRETYFPKTQTFIRASMVTRHAAFY